VPWRFDREFRLLWRWIFAADGVANNNHRHQNPVDDRGFPAGWPFDRRYVEDRPFIGLLVLAGLQYLREVSRRPKSTARRLEHLLAHHLPLVKAGR